MSRTKRNCDHSPPPTRASYCHLTVPSPPTPTPPPPDPIPPTPPITPSLHFHPTQDTSNYVPFSPSLKHPPIPPPHLPIQPLRHQPSSSRSSSRPSISLNAPSLLLPPSAVKTINGPIPNLFIVQKPAKQPLPTSQYTTTNPSRPKQNHHLHLHLHHHLHHPPSNRNQISQQT
ncbi:hypothetical protein BZA77DRAFT_309907 [Pyronema omphalodes]|nr:hypothetical protein BZA77DRAFT_309907 [Pyronema omphalodes]